MTSVTSTVSMIDRYPALIARCATTDDVRAAVRCARDQVTQFTIQLHEVGPDVVLLGAFFDVADAPRVRRTPRRGCPAVGRPVLPEGGAAVLRALAQSRVATRTRRRNRRRDSRPADGRSRRALAASQRTRERCRAGAGGTRRSFSTQSASSRLSSSGTRWARPMRCASRSTIPSGHRGSSWWPASRRSAATRRSSVQPWSSRGRRPPPPRPPAAAPRRP